MFVPRTSGCTLPKNTLDLFAPVVAAPGYAADGKSKGWKIAMLTLAEVIVWIVMGLVGGSLAGLLITRDRKGFGLVRNMGLGLAGAIVGGLLFRLLGLFPGLDHISISLRDVAAAFVGSLILATIWLWQRLARS